MRIIKIICVLFCAISVLGIVRNAVIFRSARASGSSATHSILGLCASFALAVLWVCALYGIQKKARIVWKIGWGVIVCAYLLFLLLASQSVLKVQQLPDRWIELLFVIVTSTAITGYWCYFWSKQKGYFVPPPNV